MQKLKKPVSILLVFMMIVSLFAIVPVTASAAVGDFVPESEYLTFTAEEAGSSVTLNVSTGSNLKYNLNGAGWESYSKGTQITLANVGDYVRFCGKDTTFDEYNHHVSIGGKVACSGNVMSLRLDDNGKSQGLSYDCFDNMFMDCTGLTAAPELPETNLAEGCYYCMFYGCTSLTTAPVLLATTLATYCYYGMFAGCTSLTTAPVLPATMLEFGCYSSMFSTCTSLTTAPELPATMLAQACYSGMFAYCTSLTTAPELPATTLAEDCYSGMFYGCERLTTAPELPATTLAETCYCYMFEGCTSLTTAPELPATTLAPSCYDSMFAGCSSIKLSETQTAEYSIPYSVPSGGNGTTADYALDNMFAETGGTFKGTPEINKTYYRPAVKYTVTWKNEDGTTIDTTSVYEGNAPTHADPTKAEDEQYTYTFTGWTDSSNTFYSKDNDLPAASKDETYTATYSETLRSYTITWKDGDDQTLKSESVAYGTTPSYTGATPTKTEDDDYTYEFNNTWSPSVASVTGDVTYTAQFTATAKTKPWTYNITTGGVYNCPSTMSKYTIVSGGTEENPVVIDVTQLTEVSKNIFLRSGYLIIVGNNNTVYANSGFVYFSNKVNKSSYRPAGDARLTVKDITLDVSSSTSNQYTQVCDTDYKCQSVFENVTFKNWNCSPANGAVFINDNATQTFKNCTFEGNTGAATGGLSAWSNSEVIMEGCTFKNCTATNPNDARHGGGAVWACDNAKLTLDGCTFENCTGTYGAVGIESTASLTLKGNTTITGNANGNLYLPTGATFNVADGFTGTVGVTTQTAPTDSANVTLMSGLADTQAALANNNIVSDNANYGVIYKDNSLLLINSKVYTVTWKNGDTVLKTEALAEGTTPTYDGTPEKAEDANNTYTFSGWKTGETTYGASDNLPAVTGDVTYTAQFTAKPKTLIAGHSLSLDGNIGINFYLDPSVAGLTAQQVNGDNLSYTFAWADVETTKAKVNVAEQANQKNFRVSEDGKYIIVTCHVCAAEMTCDVNASFTLGDKTESKTYSVRKYCDTVLNPTAEWLNAYNAKYPDGTAKCYRNLEELVEAMLNYGAMAQTKFGINTGTPDSSDTPGTSGKLANEGVTYNPGDVTTAMLEKAIADANPNETADNMNNVAAALGAKWFSTSLIYLDNNTIRHYFVKDTDAFKPSAYKDNKSNYYYYVEVPGIAAAELDNLQTFTVGTESFKYSALDFVKGMITSSADEDSKNLAKSLYWYNQAANAYFPAPAPAQKIVDLGTLQGDYEAQNNDVLTGTLAGQYKITIADGATVTLKDADITCLSSNTKYDGIALLGDATILLEGENTVKGGYKYNAGIFVPENKTLTIDGTGSLNVSSGGAASAIGAKRSNQNNGIPGGNIVINGGTINATGGNGGAGIGGCTFANCGTITINGGNITAVGNDKAPGIGSGNSDSFCASITINGGTVTATGDRNAAGIGSGWHSNCGDITIAGTVTQVTATKGELALNSIGAGKSGSCGTVTIEDNSKVTQN